MHVPVSWIKDFVKIELPIEELAHRLTMAGLEVEGIQYVGLPLPVGKLEGRTGAHMRPEAKISGLEWEPDKIVVAEIREVMPHPNADRLVLCRLDDGEREHIVLTGAPNLFQYKGKGALEVPLKVAYAREGAHIYDGHQPGRVVTTLQRAAIRGVDSYSMACSEKELGISDDHEGVIILDSDAPVGMPLVDYMGDAVLDIAITPNIARNANMLGVAREIAALTGSALQLPPDRVIAEGPSIHGLVSVQIEEPELNPRFVLGLIREVQIGTSPYWVQRRLKLAGMRPINNIVDATNYAMLELGEPLHAFDYDVLVKRAAGKPPVIITRPARAGERLTTLDGVEREMDDFTVLVCDTCGPLSIAGVMGGAESEVGESTRNILLEGAAWNFINVRRTVNAQRLPSEAAYRFSRGVHPAMADRGVRRGLELMRQWSGGVVDQGLVDNYPLPPHSSVVEVTPQDVQRWLGISLEPDEIADILHRLEFDVETDGRMVRATAPDHRLDIGEGVIGKADLMEEIARIYGYERIPETRMRDELPIQLSNLSLEREERIRDILASLGLQEVATYRMTSAERESHLVPREAALEEKDQRPYVQLVNPLSLDRNVLRHSLLSSLLEVVERNTRIRQRIALFELGPAFFVSEAGELPDELPRLVIALTGPRALPDWQGADTSPMDFYDLKGIVQVLLEELRVGEARYEPWTHPSFHSGKCARVAVLDNRGIASKHLGVLGELHPLVRRNYDLPETPLLVADFDLQAILELIPERYNVQPVSIYPPVLEDIAIVVDESIPAERVVNLIRQAGGQPVIDIRLFDVYRGDQIEPGKKSLAYSLTYQDPQRTLTDDEVSKIRQRILHHLEQDLGAHLRS